MGIKKVVATALAVVSALSSIAVVSAGAYERTATSDDGDGKYIRGTRCIQANNWSTSNLYTSQGCYWDALQLNKNDQTTVRYYAADVRNRWKVQAGSWNEGVYCDMMKDDKKYSVNVWAPQYNTVSVSSTATDWSGKVYSQLKYNGYATELKSRVSVDWFKSVKSGLFSAKYSTRGFELHGSIK